MHLFRSRPHTQIRRLHARRTQFLSGAAATAVAVGVLVSPPSEVDAFGSVGPAQAAVAGAVAPEAAGPAFPGVPGVDLTALGYRGVDLDAVTVAALDRAFPELPMERATDIRARMVVGAAHLEGLRQAEYLLYEAGRSMNEDVAATRRDQKRAWKAEAESAARVAQVHELAGEVTVRSPRPGVEIGVHAARAAEVASAETQAGQAHAASAALKEHLGAQLDRRAAHRAALEQTSRDVARMERHLRYLGNELAAARAGMRPAGRWLVEAERGRVDVPVVRVKGFRVHASVAGSLRDLLAAAKADGVVLTGSAHRSMTRQIELREQNCGSSPYDVYQRPSGTCSPPTARPGRSLHETGLAIDFEHDGQSIVSRSSPAYRWLAAHAPSYGFYNLPSEPWHWSVSGY